MFSLSLIHFHFNHFLLYCERQLAVADLHWRLDCLQSMITLLNISILATLNLHQIVFLCWLWDNFLGLCAYCIYVQTPWMYVYTDMHLHMQLHFTYTYSLPSPHMIHLSAILAGNKKRVEEYHLTFIFRWKRIKTHQICLSEQSASTPTIKCYIFPLGLSVLYLDLFLNSPGKCYISSDLSH